MRIGEFVKMVGTTMDTVRHYEQLGLIQPQRDKQYKDYSTEHVHAFEAISEFKSVGFTLDDIRLLFKLKESYGCGSPQLIQDVAEQFTAQIDSLNQQIAVLEGRRDRLRGFLD